MKVVASVVDEVARLRNVKSDIGMHEAVASRLYQNEQGYAGWETMLGLSAHSNAGKALAALEEVARNLDGSPLSDVRRAMAELQAIRDGIKVLPAKPPGNSYPSYEGMTIDPMTIPALFRNADQYLHDALRALPA